RFNFGTEEKLRFKFFLRPEIQKILNPVFLFPFFLVLGCQSHSVKTNPTFSEDIAPIIFKNCAPCHRPGEAGPFPLLTYDDVFKKAKTIAAVTQARYMPPWPDDTSYSHFIGERVLRDDELQMAQRWDPNGHP